jgi:glycosyltransferase involved in cell wall biosynthesis
MATLNASRTLEKALQAIRNQEYPRDLVEILVVDGGSKDETRSIALKYGARIVENPRVEPVSAKLIGLKEATGDYLIYCDADEVMENPQALVKRHRAFAENPEVKIVFASGYRSPPAAPFVSCFINEFGDPFSMFYYRLSKDFRFFDHDIEPMARIDRDTLDYCVYRLIPGARQPIMENAALANAIDLGFFRENYPELLDKSWGPVHFFYHMQNKTKSFAITKDDAVIHYSSDQWAGYLRKIKWRILNNIFFKDDMGASGFLGREKFEAGSQMRKWLFLPYALLILPAFVDSIRLMISRRDLRYLGVLVLSIYTAVLIAGYGVLKIAGYKPVLKGYGT